MTVWIGMTKTSIHIYSCIAENGYKDARLDPFIPGLSGVREMEIIINIQKVNDLEFHHAYMTEHVQEHVFVPNLCNSCFSMSKYFANPKVYINNLYNTNTHFKFLDRCCCTLDINPYKHFMSPYYKLEHI